MPEVSEIVELWGLATRTVGIGGDEPRETAEPLDWFETRQPRRWRFADGMVEYNWQD